MVRVFSQNHVAALVAQAVMILLNTDTLTPRALYLGFITRILKFNLPLTKTLAHVFKVTFVHRLPSVLSRYSDNLIPANPLAATQASIAASMSRGNSHSK